MPAYNERDNIEDVVSSWYPVLEGKNPDSRLVVADSGSTDDTHEILVKMQEKYPQLVILSDTGKQHGPKVIALYGYAIKCGADYIFQTDSDGQTLPSEFEPFWDERENWDMVIGWRNNRQDGSSRVFVTRTLKAVIRLKFGVTVTDANTPYRLMNAATLKKYIGLVPENFNLSNVVITVILTKKHCRVKYIPITFRPRQGGVNSINLKKIFKIGQKALSDFAEINKIIDRA
jgi:glycosyltransferase involved in cell wall biosynthesis